MLQQLKCCELRLKCLLKAGGGNFRFKISGLRLNQQQQERESEHTRAESLSWYSENQSEILNLQS
jgi:hypothetical protein